MADDLPRPSLRERNRLRTRAEIVQAAVPLFESHGYEETIVDEIVQSAGISTATFFRYFASKDDLLFAEEDKTTAALAAELTNRADRACSVDALAGPFVKYAQAILDHDSPDMWRMTRLVMTTPALEARSLRHRLRWERTVAAQLAREHGRSTPNLAETVIAAIAVSCLVSALRFWRDRKGPHDIADLVAEAFAHAAKGGGD